MIISLERRLCFVHVPKTAGDSITQALRPLATAGPWDADRRTYKHLPARRIARECLDGKQWRQFFTFGFVRNPWEWLHSKWCYAKMMHAHVQAHPEIVRPDVEQWAANIARAQGLTFAQFAEEHCRWLNGGLYQRWLCNGEGRQLVTFVGRFENLADDWREICRRIDLEADLPHDNRTILPDGSPPPPYQQAYDAATRDLVAANFARDIQTFGYRFDA